MLKNSHLSAISFRPCIPQDAAVAVPLIYASGPDAFKKEGGEFSYDNHYAVIFNKKMIGIGSVFSRTHAQTFSFYDALNILNFYGLKSLPVIVRGLRIERIIKLPKNNEICIAHIAININYRGKGYGEQLLHFLMQQASKQSKQYFILDVSEKNNRAKQLYERLGFEIKTKELSQLKNKVGYVANHFRMELK